MCKATQGLAGFPVVEESKATPGQVKQLIVELLGCLITKDLTFARAEFLIESGGLSDLMKVNPETFDRDRSALVNGMRPYGVYYPMLLGPSSKGAHLHFFNNFDVCQRVSSGVTGEVDQGIRDLDMQPVKHSEMSGKYLLMKFDRFLPDLDVVRGFLDRDGFLPATFHELLAYMYGMREQSGTGRPSEFSAFAIGSDCDGKLPCFTWHGEMIILLELHEYSARKPQPAKIFDFLLVKEK